MRLFLKSPTRRVLALFALFVLLLNACSWPLLNNPWFNSPTSTPGVPPGPTATPQPSAAVTFSVTLPLPLLGGETLYLSVVDEVTGLGLNPVNYAMQGMDTLHYTVTIPFPLYSVVKYRFMRQGTLPTLEDDATDKPIRYRMYYVTGPGTVQDIVSSWTDSLFSGPTGRLSGQVADSTNSAPIPNILVAVDGQQTLTDSTGKFYLPNLAAGTHNLVAYALDGTYQTFQQGVTVVEAKSTPVSLSIAPASMIEVTFSISAPANTISNAPIHFAGNLYPLGNTFGDLLGGLSSVSTRMPVLTQETDGKYSLSLMLPVGADIHYKYSLGDGFWNAEHHADGSFVVRQLIVPAGPNPLQVQDAIETWQAGPSSPITFEVSVPAETPVSDIVSIQFNPLYGWMEPIPMWPAGNNQWIYQLYSPLNMLGDFQYRYCRNDQCGVADDVATAAGQLGHPVSTSLTPEDLQDAVSAWTWYQSPAPASLVAYPVTARAAGFWAGMEFVPGYDPTWQAWMPLAVQNVKGLNANWLVLSPTWTVSRTSPFVFSPTPGMDPLWADSMDTISRARASNLNVAIFPAPKLGTDVVTWWNTAPRDTAWWDSWFARYQSFADYHADLAAKSGAGALILGGEWVTPSLPGASGSPADSDTRWRALLAEVRQHYSGAIYWAMAYPADFQTFPAFARDLDGVYLLWYVPYSGGVDVLKATAGQLLDAEIQPFQASLGKPVVIAAALPSTSASLPPGTIFQPGASQAAVDLTVQADAYQGLIAAINERAWIGGFVSRGYYPPAALQDASASIHGKPASDVLWYWYPRWLGITQ